MIPLRVFDPRNIQFVVEVGRDGERAMISIDVRVYDWYQRGYKLQDLMKQKDLVQKINKYGIIVGIMASAGPGLHYSFVDVVRFGRYSYWKIEKGLYAGMYMFAGFFQGMTKDSPLYKLFKQ